MRNPSRPILQLLVLTALLAFVSTSVRKRHRSELATCVTKDGMVKVVFQNNGPTDINYYDTVFGSKTFGLEVEFRDSNFEPLQPKRGVNTWNPVFIYSDTDLYALPEATERLAPGALLETELRLRELTVGIDKETRLRTKFVNVTCRIHKLQGTLLKAESGWVRVGESDL